MALEKPILPCEIIINILNFCKTDNEKLKLIEAIPGLTNYNYITSLEKTYTIFELNYFNETVNYNVYNTFIFKIALTKHYENYLFLINNKISVYYIKYYNSNTPEIFDMRSFNKLHTIEFMNYYNEPLGNSLKGLKSLRCIIFNNYYNKSLNDYLEGCNNLEVIKFGNFYNQPLDNSLNSLKNIKNIIFGKYFNQSIEFLYNLPKIEILIFGSNFNQTITNKLINSLPNLQFLQLHTSYRKPIDPNIIKKLYNNNVLFRIGRKTIENY